MKETIGKKIFRFRKILDVNQADIHHNQFSNNGDPSVQNGGALYSQTSQEDWGFSDRSSTGPRCEINEINIPKQ